MSRGEEQPEYTEITWDQLPPTLHVPALASNLARGSRASLMLPDAPSTELAVVATSGFPLMAVAGARVGLGEPVAGMVAQTRRPLLVNGEHNFIGQDGRRAGRYRSSSFISVPIALGDGQCGVLNVADPIGREAFDEHDLSLLQGLAHLVGQDLATAFLQRQLERARATIAELNKEVIWVQEAERNRLARELHDEAGHALTLAVLRLDLERIKPETTPEAKESLAHARDTMLGCATTLNEMAFQLRPRILEDLGLLPALPTLVGQAHDPGGPQISLHAKGKEQALGKSIELVAFRVVQESLTNIYKHSQASRAWVHLAFHPASLQIAVQDNGRGIDLAEAFAGEHSSQGLRGMRERVEAVGGTLDIRRRLRRGTMLDVRLPLRARS